MNQVDLRKMSTDYLSGTDVLVPCEQSAEFDWSWTTNTRWLNQQWDIVGFSFSFLILCKFWFLLWNKSRISLRITGRICFFLEKKFLSKWPWKCGSVGCEHLLQWRFISAPRSNVYIVSLQKENSKIFQPSQVCSCCFIRLPHLVIKWDSWFQKHFFQTFVLILIISVKTIKKQGFWPILKKLMVCILYCKMMS